MAERVVVAMSGGVDSSVAAALLKSQGYEVIGITMCFNLPSGEGERPSCCGREAVEDARRVAEKLGIRHYVLNMQKSLEKDVIADFCREYSRGRTPNPCVRCNQYVKFTSLLRKSLALGARFLATGHYARVTNVKGEWQLKKARDPDKDQSYFLYRIKKNQLKNILFPLGGLTKPEVRRLAVRFGLAVAEKPDSQEICFLPDLDYRRFLRMRGFKVSPGPILDQRGRVLGEHQGAPFYTIGQRSGLRVALGFPAYVTAIDARRNTVTVGRQEEARAREFLVKDLNFFEPLKKKVALAVQIRYNHQPKPASVQPSGKLIKVRFKARQFAITPGQSAVFYSRDRVVGGGIIDKVIG